ncbi:Oidioi.mRNA.OKI2018_I69.chr1.g1485.t1.cds [Oikopleura dioica]|uniref:Oidioi.mRNA.OKI2018_I69.chr1.g1485.t1.cds n=1 Tax=Oikopleura dioica TaxID=34765 RepID=A0ABN7SN25_OIKDI|nr:Oidioi.mRNA.OKI2018_I69.chr1.g1485.t1.cds [Oikopleura dioica]
MSVCLVCRNESRPSLNLLQGIEFVPFLIQAANSQLIQSSKSSGTLEIVTDCIANFSRNYCPDQESAYLSLFDTASRSSLTDGDEFFGASLMKVVVSLSEQNLGQELLQKSETTQEWTERLDQRDGLDSSPQEIK